MRSLSIHHVSQILAISPASARRLVLQNPHLGGKIGGTFRAHSKAVADLVPSALKLPLHHAWKQFCHWAGTDPLDAEVHAWFTTTVSEYVSDVGSYLEWAGHEGHEGGTSIFEDIRLIPPGLIRLLVAEWQETMS